MPKTTKKPKKQEICSFEGCKKPIKLKALTAYLDTKPYHSECLRRHKCRLRNAIVEKSLNAWRTKLRKETSLRIALKLKNKGGGK